MTMPHAAALLAATLAATGALAATTSTVVELPRGTHTQRILHVRPDAPVGHIVSIPGGDGIYGIQDNGTMATLTATCGPFSRTRQGFADQGFAVTLVDANSAGGIYDLPDIVAVLRYLRERDDLPIWVVGGSASTSTVAFVAVNRPADIPVGVIFFSPQRPGSIVPSITGPALVVYHAADSGQFGNSMFNALTAAAVRDRVVLNGGNSFGCTHHLFDGLDALFIETTTSFMRQHNALTTAPGANFQALWYRGESESGWGVNVTHQGDILFATWFTYDTDGSQMWLVAPSVNRTAGNNYAGALYRTTGPAFDSVPFNSAQIAATQVGTVSFSFTDAGSGTFNATLNGVSISKPIVRQVFSTVPTCAAGGSPGATLNFQDLWYRAPAESESGWGVNITHQGEILFATWFTYDAGGRGMWLVGPDVRRTTGNTFSGALYRTTGPAFSANPWNPAGVGVTQVGTATFAFGDAANGTFTYTVNGVTQSKPITRQVYGSPATVCR